jgi:hypothetical protein
MEHLPKPFALQAKFLKLLGFWQTKSSTWAYFCYGVIVHFVFFECLVASQIMFLVKSKNLVDLTMVVSLAVTNLLMILRTLNFMTKVEKVEELFKTIEKVNQEFGKGRELRNMKFIDKIGRFIWLEMFVLSFSSILALIMNNELAVKLWYPFEFEIGGLAFWIIAVLQTVLVCTVSGADTNVEILPTILIGGILDLTKKLAEDIESLTTVDNELFMLIEETNETENLEQNKRPILDLMKNLGENVEILTEVEAKEIQNPEQIKPEQPKMTREETMLKLKAERSKLLHKKLENCVEFHLKIMDIKRKVEGVFSPVLLAHAVISTLVLCTSVYKLSLVRSATAQDFAN